MQWRPEYGRFPLPGGGGMENISRPLLTVCELGRIGDIIASEPIYRYLREHYPDRLIRWYTRPLYAELLKFSPWIDEVEIVADAAEYLKRKAELPAGTLSFELNFRYTEEGRRRNGKTVPGALPSLLEQFAVAAGLPPLDETPVFHFAPNVTTPPLPERYFVFHCTSQGRARQWPPSKWNALAEHFFAAGTHVVEIGLAPVIRSGNPLYTDLTGRRSLQEVGRVVAQSAGLIGVDSGFSHMANATGTFGVIITGRLRNQPGFNPYSGSFRRGENANLVRFYDELAVRVPVSLAAAVSDRLIAGNPMSGAECEIFCLTEQIRRARSHWWRRLAALPRRLYDRIQTTLILHWSKHRPGGCA